MKIEITRASEDAKKLKQEYKDFIKALDVCPCCGHRNHSFRCNYKCHYKLYKEGTETRQCTCKACGAVWNVWTDDE